MEYTTEQLFDLLDSLHPASPRSIWTREDEAKFQEIKRLVANYWTQFSKAQDKSEWLKHAETEDPEKRFELQYLNKPLPRDPEDKEKPLCSKRNAPGLICDGEGRRECPSCDRLKPTGD